MILGKPCFDYMRHGKWAIAGGFFFLIVAGALAIFFALISIVQGGEMLMKLSEIIFKSDKVLSCGPGCGRTWYGGTAAT